MYQGAGYGLPVLCVKIDTAQIPIKGHTLV